MNVENLYNTMIKEYSDNGKIKKITDDLVAFYNEKRDTYYVNFHAKDFELYNANITNVENDLISINNGNKPMIDKKSSSVFLAQMWCFNKWLKTVKSSTVILMADLNTDCEINMCYEHKSKSVLKFKNKENKGIEYSLIVDRVVEKTNSEFSTTNKMRLMTAQLPKMFKTSKSTGDVIFVFHPNTYEIVQNEDDDYLSDLIHPQITCENGVFTFRTSEHFQETDYPSDHDALLFYNTGSLNCCSSGACFDGTTQATNTYEFVPENGLAELKTHENIIMNVLSQMIYNVLEIDEENMFDNKGYFSKLTDQFSSPRCDLIDIHLHPDWMPIIYVYEDNQWVIAIGTETVDEFIERKRESLNENTNDNTNDNTIMYLDRLCLWRDEFERFVEHDPIYMKTHVMKLLNTWQMIINDNSCKEFFSNWYDEVTMYTNTKLSLVNYLFENNVDVVGLQELTKKDVDIIKNVFTENEYSVTFNETQQCPGYSTVGCIICKL
jgi:hypothetical protein